MPLKQLKYMILILIFSKSIALDINEIKLFFYLNDDLKALLEKRTPFGKLSNIIDANATRELIRISLKSNDLILPEERAILEQHYDQIESLTAQDVQANSILLNNNIIYNLRATGSNSANTIYLNGTSIIFANSGNGNTALGYNALTNNPGNHNIAIGSLSGNTLSTGTNNIYIANSGQSTEYNTTRIGSTQTACYVAGITNNAQELSVMTIDPATGLLGASILQTGSFVVGPTSSTDNAIALFDGITGKLIKNSTAIVSGDDLTITGSVTAAGLDIAGSVTFASLPTDKGSILTVNGTGLVGKSDYFTSGDSIYYDGTRVILTDIIKDNYTLGSSNLNPDNSTGNNIALGFKSLQTNNGTNSDNNIALGKRALATNKGDNSNKNIALGYYALYTNSGHDNIAIGQDALRQFDSTILSNSMNSNIAIGYQAGYNLSNGDNNIYIANAGPGSPGTESNTTKIGSTQTACYIAGITNNAQELSVMTIDPATGLLGASTLQTGSFVVGPTSATNNAIALFNGTTGKLIKNSTAIVSGDDLTITGSVTAAGLDIAGSVTFASLPTQEGSILTANGIGLVGESLYSTSNSPTAILYAGTQVILTDTINYNYALGNNNLVTNNSSGGYNIALGSGALQSNLGLVGYKNIAIGVNALQSNTGDGSHNNIALGNGALLSNAGAQSFYNIALGSYALKSNAGNSSYGNIALGLSALATNAGAQSHNNIALGNGALFSNAGTQSHDNIALGHYALAYSSGDSSHANIALGNNALLSNAGTQSHDNIALGRSALLSNSGDNSHDNIALGRYALLSNTGDNSFYNIALGANALYTNSGNNNIAIGFNTLSKFDSTIQSNSLNSNIAIGNQAGYNLSNGDNNIYLANVGPSSLTTESNTIRIGDSSTQTACYIAGISGATVAGASAVYTNSTGQLGTINSSRRYKDNIKNLNQDAISKIDLLRPVEFNYKVHSANDVQYGLIAEEVLEDAKLKELVIFNKDGNPESVQYHNLPVLLLARLQQLIKENNELKNDNVELRAKVDYILKHAQFKKDSLQNRRSNMTPNH